MTERNSDERPRGYAEAVLGVRDTGPWREFFCQLGDWEVLHAGPAGAAGPATTTAGAEELLLGRLEWPCGRVRLVAEPAGAADLIRPQDSMPWDTGGIFDLDIRCADLHHLREQMLELGWADLSRVVDWQFGDLHIREWLARGPEGVVVAVVQRLYPPLDPPLPLRGFGNAFNSSQTVGDIDAALGFYAALGFESLARHSGPLGGGGGEVLGFSAEAARDTPVELAIVAPDGAMNGSVELVAMPQSPGRDLAARAAPGGLGIRALRFPVPDLPAFARRLAREGLAPVAGPAEVRLEPFGTKSMLAVRSPDGALLEFYEERA